MRYFDSLFVWVLIIAIVAVTLGSGSADKAITSIGTVISSLINVIVAPAKGKAQ